MNLDRFSLLLILTLLGYYPGYAQQQARVPGQVLASLHAGLTPELLNRRMETAFTSAPIVATKVSNLLNVWLLETELAGSPEILDWIRRQPEVFAAQYNYILENRDGGAINLLPNDPLLGSQWQYVNNGANGGVPNADFDADLAWDIATGGVTPAGDTIVIAVIDGGVDQNHGDLASNLWKNKAEIPNDGIDNDGNGYTDDYRGWNVWDGNDDISGFSTGHGTPVSAIVGARGNNGNGVTGINWNVKIMFIAGGGTQANILSAYDYVLQARRRYNSSNGQSGAFVVATNCSWGTDYGQPSNAPLWCAAFDSLGHEGILSIAATANNPVNVDAVGDLPTTCPNDFLIAVTSLTNADLKAPNAAWGATHVDLGAYGHAVFTAGANNSYGVNYGTSFAAPAVSGAIGLLYSAPCPDLITLAKTDPAAAAIWTKNLLLNSTVPNNSLQGITATGGRLNLFTLLQDYQDQCSDCSAPFALVADDVTSNSALLKWLEMPNYQTVTLYWRPAGGGNWNTVNGVENTYLLENLAPCTEYEFKLSAQCAQGVSSDASLPVVFKTDGCCTPPASIWADNITASEVSVAWNPVTAANGYKVRLRIAGGGWQIFDAGGPEFTFFDLLPCTEYETGVQTLCDTGSTAFSGSLFFTTAGCGSCTDASYCQAKSQNAGDEWISSIVLGDWEHTTGSGGGGYQDFTGNTQTVAVMLPQTPENVTITPGFQSFPYKEYFRIFIDFNMDGDFDDDGELAFNPAWATENPVSGQIIPPLFPNEGLTRMRVMMKYKGPGALPPAACETFEFGQVEDYCVELSFGVNTPVDLIGSPGAALHVYPQPAQESVWLEWQESSEDPWSVLVWDASGRQVLSNISSFRNGLMQIRTNDWKTGVYFIQLTKGDRMFRGKLLKG